MREFGHVRHLLVALACAALVGACTAAPREPARAAATLAPCSPAASPAPAPSGTASRPTSAGDVFTQLTDFPSAGAFEVTSVIWSQMGFVAVGFGPMPGQDYFGLRQGIVWTSCDGLSWQQMVDTAFEHVTPTSVTAVGSDLFVVGDLVTCPEFDEECREVPDAGNVLVRSSSTGPWQRLSLPSDIRLAYIEGAAAVGGRLAVYGSADDENLSPTLWSSADGQTWTSTTDLAGMDPITTLIPLADGMLAFGGEYIDDLEEAQLAAATSPDGVRFTRVTAPPLLGGTVNSATAGPAGYVGVGVGYPGDAELALKAVALFSADGQSWSEASATDGSFERSTLDRVHPLPNGYVAVGFVADDADFTSQSGRIWLSADGRGWRIAGDYAANVTDYETSALGPDGLIVLTVDQQETDDGEVSGTIGAYFAPLDRLTP